MLENFAAYVLTRSESEISILGLLMTAAGFLVALVLRRGKTLSLRRVPYFIGSAAVIGLLSALPIAWTLTLDAVEKGILWILVAFVFSGIFAAGVAFGVLGHARSVNAFGDGRSAWMAMVPIANILLLFKAPLDAEKASNDKLVPNILGIVFGFILVVVGSNIGKIAEQEIETQALNAEVDPTMQAGVEMVLRGQGLEETLRQMATNVPSQRIDETTILLRTESNENTLRHVYEMTTSESTIPDTLQVEISEGDCAYEPYRPLIMAGARFEHLFQRQDGLEIGRFIVTRELCGY